MVDNESPAPSRSERVRVSSSLPRALRYFSPASIDLWSLVELHEVRALRADFHRAPAIHRSRELSRSAARSLLLAGARGDGALRHHGIAADDTARAASRPGNQHCPRPPTASLSPRRLRPDDDHDLRRRPGLALALFDRVRPVQRDARTVRRENPLADRARLGDAIARADDAVVDRRRPGCDP